MNLFEMIVGALMGAFLVGFVSWASHYKGQEECEKPLPRTEKCVKVWVPEVKKQ